MNKHLNIKTFKLFSIDSIRGKVIPIKKTKYKKKETEGGLEDCLELGVGSRVMLRRNSAVESGLMNGSLGTVVILQQNSHNHIYKIFVLSNNF